MEEERVPELIPELWLYALSFLPDGFRLPARLTCRRWAAALPNDTRDPRAAMAGAGFVGALRFLRTLGPALEWDESTCAAAGTTDCLRALREAGCPWDEKTCAQAASRGDMSVLAWARRNGCPWDGRTPMAAARRGFVKILRYARDEGCPWTVHGRPATWCDGDETPGVRAACADPADLLACADFVRVMAPPAVSRTRNAAHWAARCGRLDCLRLLVERGETVDVETYGEAVAAGAFDCMDFLRALVPGCEHDMTTAFRALRWDRVECLREWEQGARMNPFLYSWPHGACALAAFYGSPDCLRYAHHSGQPLSVPVYSGCSLDALVQGFVSRLPGPPLYPGNPYRVCACSLAAAADRVECFRVARLLGCTLHHHNAVMWAVASGGLNCLRHMLHNEPTCVWNTLVCHAACTAGRFAVLRFAHEEAGCPLADDLLVSAVAGNSRACISYLIRKGCRPTRGLGMVVEELARVGFTVHE